MLRSESPSGSPASTLAVFGGAFLLGCVLSRLNSFRRPKCCETDIEEGPYSRRRYQRLKDPMEFANASWKVWGGEKRAEKFMRHTTHVRAFVLLP